ncbi:MAG: aminomethyl-transferring glycine dehydrogenase [Aestuariivita sp.]|nr:aminomethyl-transferring glycine dehydrogenase [Aestuariivita sp.]
MSFQLSNYSPDDFANRRHIGPSPSEMEQMLEFLGVNSVEDIIDQAVPSSIRQAIPLDFDEAQSERTLLHNLRKLAAKNQVMVNLIGQGYHGTVTPPAIQRNILENPAWYTAYTPYQPEISQGRLEALLNFQTMVCDLTGLEIANASLLDESTACAEAMTMARKISKSKSNIFFADVDCHPQNIAVIQTRAAPLGIDVIVGCLDEIEAIDVFGAIFQYPGTTGNLHDFSKSIAALRKKDTVSIISADPLSLTLFKEPGAMGADIAVGSTQRFGVPIGYGGPHAAYMATRHAYARSMPGRIVGVSVDSHGNRAYRLSLQTREQHIRREKATSNICTSQALLAVVASFYAVFHGPEGLKAIAQRIHCQTAMLADGLREAGFVVCPEVFFDTITVEVGPLQQAILKSALNEGINLRSVGETQVGITLDETTRPQVIETVWQAFGINRAAKDPMTYFSVPDNLVRETDYLSHPIFHMNRAETEMTRYMRRLADRDLALDRAMIPLGSCTMKLNSAAEMMPISWPEFAWIHPFCPPEQAKGYTELISELCQQLCDITGYAGISMQPNSGAQGEYAGLLTIAAYHRSKGQGHRNICLIPMNAHGTNPASARMVGWKVVAIRSTKNGDIDLGDFRAKAEMHSENLAGCMITYPSTHGVFEETVTDICEITHKYGGQVYIDGANMNAMVGISRPGDLGGDVSHLNLHKTFCIPHGGGGPGMGPIGVKKHLVDYLPGHSITGGNEGPVSAAPYGSPLLLPIAWGYCKLMGGSGLTQATRVAILNANYIATRLQDSFDVLYRGRHGRVAHECIIDMRPFFESAGVSVDDIAKRLIDCGFHAPTMSWPVAGTLMIEPTESETKAELDRFCDAMLAIREEISKIEKGEMSRVVNPIKLAPHTMEDLVRHWERPYSREAGCFPPGAFRVDKYWPPVNRVDNSWGDRHLICTCPPMGEYDDTV